MRQWCAMAVFLAIGLVIMDRVVVQRHGLKGREIGVANRSGWTVEYLADRQLLKPAQGHNQMLGRIETRHR